MYQYAYNGLRFKAFVKEQTDTDAPEIPNASKNKFIVPKPLTGDKAKEFYESIIKDASSAVKETIKPKPTPKPKKKIADGKKFKNNDLLSMAQNNDVKNLNLFFSQNQNCDVNITDEFGWTPLMCAACSGAKQAVEILLNNGADMLKSDRLGNNALSLAKQRKQREIVEILENFGVSLDEEEEESEEPPKTEFFCPNCKEKFKTNKNKHESTMLHMFNCKIKTQTFYGIPESNKGFQLLLREGWDKEKGLGVDGKGRKFPVKAVMKKDRTGIGASPPKNVKREHTKNYENKQHIQYKRWKDKNFEKNFRMEFS